MDVHDSKGDYEKTLRKMLNSDLSKANKKLIQKYVDDCFARGISFSRCNKYVYHLTYMARWLGKDYSKATGDEIKKLVSEIEQSDYKPKTKSGFKQALKSFYIFLDKKHLVDWIKTSVKRHQRYLPEDLLTHGEIESILEAANFARDKAIISTLAAGGLRPAELLALRVKDIEEDSNGMIVHVPSGKTGARRVRIIEHQKYLRDWLFQHPFKKDRNAPAWPQLNQALNYVKKSLGYRGLTSRLGDLFKKAKVEKNLNPYIFRHTLATKFAGFMTPAELEKFMGWVPGSAMPSIYTHMSGKAVDDKLLTHYGLKEVDESKKPKRCPRCQDINPPTSQFCGRCGSPLSLEIALEVEDLKGKISDQVKIKDQFVVKVEMFEKMMGEIRDLKKEVGELKSKG